MTNSTTVKQNQHNQPGTACTPVPAPIVNTVLHVNEVELNAIVAQRVEEYLRSLPLARLQCVTVDTAAELLVVSPGTLRGYIRDGLLEATKFGNEYRIALVAIEQYMRNHSTIKKLRRA